MFCMGQHHGTRKPGKKAKSERFQAGIVERAIVALNGQRFSYNPRRRGDKERALAEVEKINRRFLEGGYVSHSIKKPRQPRKPNFPRHPL